MHCMAEHRHQRRLERARLLMALERRAEADQALERARGDLRRIRELDPDSEALERIQDLVRERAPGN